MKSDLWTENPSEVFKSLNFAVTDERRAGLAVLEHLRVIQDRKLYLERGYPNLFELCTKSYGFSAGAAQRRIEAMRLIKDLPEIQEKIKSGKISVSTAASVQSFFRAEKKAFRPKDNEEKLELLKSCEGKSTREVERELAKRSPQIPKRECVRAVDGETSRLAQNLSNETLEKLDRLKALRSHADQSTGYENLIDWLAELGLEKIDPARAVNRKEKRAQAPLLPAPEVTRNRSIRAADNRKVWQVNRGQGCDYVDQESGHRCGSMYFLQRDHIQPWSHGGANDAANLRLLCSDHNRWVYGKSKALL